MRIRAKLSIITLTCAATAILSACASDSGSQSRRTKTPPVNTAFATRGKVNTEPPKEIAKLDAVNQDALTRAAQALMQGHNQELRQQAEPSTPQDEAATSAVPVETEVAEADIPPADPEAEVTTADANDGDISKQTPLPAAPQQSPQRRLETLVDEIASLMLEEARASDGPFDRYLELALLEGIRPGSLRLDDPTLTSTLSPPEIRTLEAVRDAVVALARGSAAGGDPAAAAQTFEKLADSLSDTLSLRIRETHLCSRVAGFAQYAAFPSNAFLAGRPHPIIVYVELERFAHRPARTDEGDASGGFAVDLSQTLELWSKDGTLVWSRGPERDIGVSQRPRRDYFLTHRVTLPRTLSVGSYAMKVLMKDNTTGAEASAIIPLRIVADAELVAGG